MRTSATSGTLAPEALPAVRDRRRSDDRAVRAVLAGILAAAGLLYAWGLNHGSYQPFYGDAVRSMSMSWKAFVFGAFDPGGTVTLDKVPGFLWPQALSARLFGFHPWAVTLPQVLEGVLAVLVLFRTVRCWAGARAGLVAAGLFAVTPVVVGLFRGATEEPAFTLLLLLAAEAAQRAAREARLRPLLLAGVWVGLAFQAKMLEAWVVLPALAVVYGVSAPTGLRRRIAHLGLAGAVAVAVSASWVVLVCAVPARDRPYVDGTTDNSAVTMVVGYNFLNRFSSVGVSQADGGSVPASRHAAAGGSGRPTGSTGWGKLLGSSLTAQTGWLYPFGLLAAVAGFRLRRGRPRTDRLRAGFLLQSVWLASFALVISAGSIGGHVYYTGVVAAPLAALTGAGMVLLRGGAPNWALPGAVAVTVAWECAVALRFRGFLPWLVPLLAALGTGAVLLLAVRGRRLPGVWALAVAVAAVLPGPLAWSTSVLDPRYAHSSGLGGVGPVAERGGGEPRLTIGQRELLAYTAREAPGARYRFAVTSWTAASPYILAAGAAVLPMGGFSGQAPVPTLDGLRRDVAAGELRFVLLPSATAALPPTADGVARWVRAACAPVPPHRYGAPPGDDQRLYDCAAR